MTDYSISRLVEPYLHNELYLVFYKFIGGNRFEYLRFFDLYRGNLGVAYHLGLISTGSLIFLSNFLAWLECKENFSEYDDDMYSYFYNKIVKEMDEYFDRN